VETFVTDQMIVFWARHGFFLLVGIGGRYCGCMAIAFDIGNPEAIAHELALANRSLADERDVPLAVARLVIDVADAVSEADPAAVAAVDPQLWQAIQDSADRGREVSVDEDMADRRREMRLSIERLRFLLARLAERIRVGDQRPAVDIARWLAAELSKGGVDLEAQARLVGVDQDTFASWLSEEDEAVPTGASERRVRLAARAINELVHSLSPSGAVEWFGESRADLMGATPHDLLMDERESELMQSAMASRSSSAA
jgi:hypothetical protein